MKLHTERMARREVARRWVTFPACRRYQVNQLEALGDEPTIAQIAEIVGHRYAAMLTQLTCSECERQVSGVVEFDASMDTMESAEVCLECLQEAVRRLQAEIKP